MKWSWKIFRVAGIDICLHWTFLLLISWIFFSQLAAGSPWGVAWLNVVFVMALFGCVLMHELGHALAAKMYGVPTKDITLVPIGGVARLDRIPERPLHEFVIAIAGPIVNLAIAASIYLILLNTNVVEWWIGELSTGRFWQDLMWANVGLVLFNMIPAFPMDGGRILRSALASRLEYTKATRIAASFGQVIAIVFALVGLFVVNNPLLLLVAIFVYLGASAESQMVDARFILRGIPVRDAMMTRFHTLSPDDSLRVAARELLAGTQQDFPVMEQGQFLGILRRTELAASLADSTVDCRVKEVMTRDCFVVSEFDLLDSVMLRMQQGCLSVAVVRGDRLVGLVDTENIGELLMIRAAFAMNGSHSCHSTNSSLFESYDARNSPK